MKKLLCIHRGDSFFGNLYFKKPWMFEEEGIEVTSESVPDYSVESLEVVAKEHPEETVDGVLIHRLRVADALTEAALYCDTPVCVAGHVLCMTPGAKRRWENAVHSGRELYVFTGAVRAARSYHRPDQENLQVVLAPIMGRSKITGVTPQTFVTPSEKEFDIGFFSSITLKKQPHQVLETANEVAKRLGKILSVWIAGPDHANEYQTLLEKLIKYDHYEHINVTYHGLIPNQRDLFDTVQNTQVVYLPLVKPTETTCYAAWETVSYDVPLVATDWAGVGEATRHSRHPLSSVVPVKSHKSLECVFSESVRDAYPKLVEDTVKESATSPIMIDLEKAVNALTDALETETSYTRKFSIPDRIHAKSTVNAFGDILHGEELDPEEIPSDRVSTTKEHSLKTTRGYSLLREPRMRSPLMHQTSFYQPLTE